MRFIDVIRPALSRLVQELALDEPGTFWQLFELLTRESLTLPIAGNGPPFSGICADGTPWQFCVSLRTAGTGGLRYLTEIGLPGTPMSARVSLSRRRLDDVMDLLDLPPESNNIVDGLFALLPQEPDRLNSLRGAIWVGVRAANGKLDFRVYANNEWGTEFARWQRLTTTLGKLGGAGFGRLLRDHIADLTQYFSPVGLASSLELKPVLKLYLRSKTNPWEACARLSRSPSFHLPPDLLTVVEHVVGRPLATAPNRLLVLSIAASIDGKQPDLKFDLNCQYLSHASHPPEKAIEELARASGIDLAPYWHMLNIVQGSTVGGPVPIHDFIGIGGGINGLRLNVYLRPPVPASASRKPDCAIQPGIPRSVVARSVERAVRSLLAAQSADGAWVDFQLPVGRGSCWVTACVGRSLLAARAVLFGHADILNGMIYEGAQRAVRYLAAARRPSGWGFNETTESDADSTALAILLWRSVHGKAGWMQPTLEGFRRPDGAYGTFRQVDHDNWWSEPHADVLPTVLEALHKHGPDAEEMVLRHRCPDGSWHSYWWTTGLYAAATSLRFLASPRLTLHRNESRDWVLKKAQPRDAFVAALGMVALSQLDPGSDTRRAMASLAEMLLNTQQPDGLWPAAAGLCVPNFHCAAPWEFPNEVRTFTDTGLFTTAQVLCALTQTQFLKPSADTPLELNRASPKSARWGSRPADAAKLVFLYSSQGSQWPGMGRHFYRKEPVFRRKVAECDAVVQRHLGWSLLDGFASDAACQQVVSEERIQPTVTALQIALVELLASREIHPAAIVGLSMGELAGTVSAGILTVENAMLVACCEARLTREKITPGRMAFIHLPTRTIREFLEDFNRHVSVAVELSPKINIISGEEAAVASAIARLVESGVRCRSARIGFAFHSPLVLPFKQTFVGPLQGMMPESGFLPVYSSLTGRKENGALFDCEYWWQIVYKPALFRSAIEAMLSDGFRMFLELGPHPVLLPAVRDIAHASKKEIGTFCLMRRNCDDAAELERLVQLSRSMSSPNG
jgi:malonyl CoA-acyl carrier protein transacylase